MINMKYEIRNYKEMRFSLFIIFYLLFIIPLSAQETAKTPDPVETARFNTIKYGTETEIAALIQALKNEGNDYLDNEIITLSQNTRNQKILSGAFAFFGEREKSGLEERAIRAIDDRDNEDNETVLAAVDYLGRVKYTAAAAVLRELIDSREKRFLNAAFRSLGRISVSEGEADEAADYLVDFYQNRDPGDDNRREMITAMGVTGSARAMDFLAGIACDNEERFPLRIAALEAIAKIGSAGNNSVNQRGMEAVLVCISAKDPNVRSAAVAALGPFSGKAVDDAILDAFRDSFFRTRIAAAQASRQRKLEAAVPFLQFRAERDEVPAVRENAVRALGEIANAESMAVLENLFKERKNSNPVRIAAGEMLMRNEPEKYLDIFVKELDEAKQKSLTQLYNGFLKIIGSTTSGGMESFTRRLMLDKGVIEKSYALDMAANNNLTGLANEIKAIAGDKNESLSRKARRTMEKLGIE